MLCTSTSGSKPSQRHGQRPKGKTQTSPEATHSTSTYAFHEASFDETVTAAADPVCVCQHAAQALVGKHLAA